MELEEGYFGDVVIVSRSILEWEFDFFKSDCPLFQISTLQATSKLLTEEFGFGAKDIQIIEAMGITGKIISHMTDNQVSQLNLSQKAENCLMKILFGCFSI